jgi:hypothetical protein
MGPLIKPRIVHAGTLMLVMLMSGNAGRSQSLPASNVALPWTVHPFSRIGLDSHAGLGGIGFEVATPLARRFNIRAGSDFFGYSTTFQDQGANVVSNLRMRWAHASLDWFPFGGRFRLSPLVVFANNNQAKATAVITSAVLLTLCTEAVRSILGRLHPALRWGWGMWSRAPATTGVSRWKPGFIMLANPD